MPSELTSKIKRGSVVIVPWRSQLVLGVVKTLKKTSNFKTKPVTKLISGLTLGSDILETILWMSQEYLSAPSNILYALFPKPPKKMIGAWERNSSQVLTTPAHKLMPRSRSSSSSSKQFFAYENFEHKLALIQQILAKNKGATLIIVPHLIDLELISAGLKQLNPQLRLATVAGTVSASENWSQFINIARGQIDCVIGTRMSVLTPLAHLNNIILTETTSHDHRQYDQNPRFDARSVASHRAGLASAKLFLMSPVPRLEDILETAQPAPSDPNFKLISLPKSFKNSQDLILSQIVLDKTEFTLSQNKQVVFFFNRRGQAKFLLCPNCGWSPRCQHCQTKLTVLNSDELGCSRCAATAVVPPQCQVCGQPQLKNIGLGLKTLTTILRSRFPNIPISSFSGELESELWPIGPAIIVGTQAILHKLTEEPRSSPLGLVVMVDLEQLLMVPGFRNVERAWRILNTLNVVATATNTELYVQISDSERSSIKSVLKSALDFWPEEIALRRSLNYPPFGRLVKISIRKSKNYNAKILAEKLISDFKKLALRASVAGPFPPRRLRDALILVIKTPQLGLTLQNWLKALPDYCLIEKDPEEL